MDTKKKKKREKQVLVNVIENDVFPAIEAKKNILQRRNQQEVRTVWL